MPKLVGLVRGINVGGANLVKMADLRAFVEELGATEVATLLQSGNFVFEAGRRSAAAWQRILASESHKRLGIKPDFFVRTKAQWTGLVHENPFKKEAKSDPAKTIAIVFNSLPTRKGVEAIKSDYKGPERIALGKHALYVFYPNGMGASKLSANSAWRKLTASGTARNWNTVLKLAEMLGR